MLRSLFQRLSCHISAGTKLLEAALTPKTRRIRQRKLDLWPIYEEMRPDGTTPTPYTGDSGQVVQDMIAALDTHGGMSTTEALARLRQIYPQYPLTLRLAALVAHMKTAPADPARQQSDALRKIYRELSGPTESPMPAARARQN